MLLGLITVVIPPIIHLLSRRRFDVVDWGAMQFLAAVHRRSSRISLNDLLLMFLRMATLGLLVLMLAGPYLQGSAWRRWAAGRAHQDIVVVIDGSFSMGYRHDGLSAQDRARQWLGRFFEELRPGDGVAILYATRQVRPIVGTLTTDHELLRTALENLPSPTGNVDWPLAIQTARQLLADQGQRANRAIVVLTDKQRYGWGDENTLLRWAILSQADNSSATKPRIWVINVDPQRPEEPPNLTLQPIRTNRPVTAVQREVTFRAAVHRKGVARERLPARLRVEVDEKPAGEIPLPGLNDDQDLIPVTFTHRFAVAGSHLVTFILEDDALPGDNRQHYALEVIPALPVLIVDGDDRPNPPTRSSDFLRDALAPGRDPSPVAIVRVVPIQAFDESSLSRDLPDREGSTPRVVIFCDIPRFETGQREAIEKYLAARNGVLVLCGPRVDAEHYNSQHFRNGQGWLPARLVEAVGDSMDLTKAARPIPASFFHPALEIFRDVSAGGLADVLFPRHWRLSMAPASQSVPIATLTDGDPLLVERSYKEGRVILSTVPFDPSWRSNLTEMPAFVPLVHELVSYLAGSRDRESNLAPGQPIRFQPVGESAWSDVRVRLPDGQEITRTVEKWPFVFEETREPGVYTIHDRQDRPHFFVVPWDTRESQLARLRDDDEMKVKNVLPEARFLDANTELGIWELADSGNTEVWWLVLLLATALIFVEVALTRRLARKRAM